MKIHRLLLSLIFVTALSAEAATLRRGVGTEPRSLDPHLGLGNAASVIINDLFEGLMTVGPDGKVTHGAAETWTVSPDGRVYTFTLRPGLVWSDGTPLTAEDFVYSFRRLLTPATVAAFASLMYPIKGARAVNSGQAPADTIGVAAPDARTVVFTLEAPAAFFPQLMAANAAAPVPKHVIEAKGREWTLPGNLVSNGAYVLTEAVPQTHYKGRKNPRFHGAAGVRIDDTVYYPTEDQGTTLNRFRAGELDVALNFPPDQTEAIRKEMPEALHMGRALGLYYLVLNHERPQFRDPRVRRALSMAIDREALVARILPPGAEPALHLVPPATSDFTGQPADFGRLSMAERLSEARRLLAEAGYGPAKPLAFSFKFDSLEQNRRLGLAVGAMWRAVGVNVTLDNVGAQSADRDARTGNFEVVRWTWFAPYDDAYSFLALLEGGNPVNRSRYADPAYDALVRRSREALAPAARRALMQEAEAFAMAENAVIPVYFQSLRRLVRPHVQGWVDNPRNVNLARWLSLRGSPAAN